jgi:hypothetical protein
VAPWWSTCLAGQGPLHHKNKTKQKYRLITQNTDKGAYFQDTLLCDIVLRTLHSNETKKKKQIKGIIMEEIKLPRFSDNGIII